ncbi:tetratricopeptide [Lophium mytilinum]|uniref:Tetratricopeptide n=1 Tax=Lophium mytilinum TaxID=390894 RepID=A0A6A6Q9D4_9PEZI|nr:tetratricopeptide [Lophium mytilinum]
MAPQNDGNTIFLTEKEADRIRKTIEAKLKKCSESVGNAREPRDSKAAIQQATGMSLMADMGGSTDPDLTQPVGRGRSLPAIGVGQPYPPCIVPLRDLKPMKLADLKMETHHRGRRLTVKCARRCPVVTHAARSWTMVQNEAGDETERLEICLHKSRHGEDVLESASVYIIKEPYFTFTNQGEATLRIDHPSDLIICRDEVDNSSLLSVEGTNREAEDAAAAAETTAKSCKDNGNAALKLKDLPLAHAKYTEGLKVARQEAVSTANPDLARDISRNRAHVNLALSQLDEAKTDAIASLTGREDQRSKELDTKAYFRAGCAAYSLGEYQEAKNFFQELQKLTPSDRDSNTYLRLIKLRLREQEDGSYNFTKLRANLSRTHPRVDVATFTSNTTVKDSPGRGRGLFAARQIAAGGIIMGEKAFCVVYGHESDALTAMTYDVRDERIRVSPVGLGVAAVQKLLSNPSQIDKFMDLRGEYQGDGKNVSMTEDGPVVDTLRVHDIVSRNGFGLGSQYGEDDASNASTGIWIWTAYANHSCIAANAEKEFIGDLMVLRATRPIEAGEEIFISYDWSSDYDARQSNLMTTWGFECDCALCVAEKADDPSVRTKRRELEGEADAFIEREHWAKAKRIAVAKAQRLAQAIDETYDVERYKGVPRIAALRILDWLEKAK